MTALENMTLCQVEQGSFYINNVLLHIFPKRILGTTGHRFEIHHLEQKTHE